MIPKQFNFSFDKEEAKPAAETKPIQFNLGGNKGQNSTNFSLGGNKGESSTTFSLGGIKKDETKDMSIDKPSLFTKVGK